MYTRSGNKHTIHIGGKTIQVDSNLEERVLTELENQGFHNKWRRTKRGLSVNGKNYTPDVELSLGVGNDSYRALVEIKPSVTFFLARSYPHFSNYRCCGSL